MEEGQEGLGGFVVAGSDAPELLETIEHSLDAIAVPVLAEVAEVESDDRQNGDRP